MALTPPELWRVCYTRFVLHLRTTAVKSFLTVVITQIGLLPKDNPEQVPLAYKMYKSTGDQNVSLAAGFKQTFCRDVKIEFVGVW